MNIEMTGRDLIVYILENHLENEKVFEDGKFLGFMTVTEAAVKFNVGISTVRMWIELGRIPHVRLGCMDYIPCDTENPIKHVSTKHLGNLTGGGDV